jgi:hypothetical protein
MSFGTPSGASGALLINQNAYSWSDVSVTVGASVPFTVQTIKSIDYGITIDVEQQYGAGQFPYGRTDGIVKAKQAKLTVGLSDWMNILSGIGGSDALITEASAFNITVNYAANFTDVQTTDLLQDCRIVDYSIKPEQGAAGIMVDVTLDVLYCQLGSPTLSFLGGAVIINF